MNKVFVQEFESLSSVSGFEGWTKGPASGIELGLWTFSSLLHGGDVRGPKVHDHWPILWDSVLNCASEG